MKQKSISKSPETPSEEEISQLGLRPQPWRRRPASWHNERMTISNARQRSGVLLARWVKARGLCTGVPPPQQTHPARRPPPPSSFRVRPPPTAGRPPPPPACVRVCVCARVCVCVCMYVGGSGGGRGVSTTAASFYFCFRLWAHATRPAQVQGALQQRTGHPRSGDGRPDISLDCC